MKRSVSAKDVADRAGVSRTTVSFVLNNTAGAVISEDTRARVLAAARELGYVPNLEARALSMTRHHAVGLFVCHPRSLYSDSFIVPLVDGIVRVLNRHRYRLVLQQVRAREPSYRRLVAEDQVDGVILVNPHYDDTSLDEIVAEAFPIVVIGSTSPSRVSQVDVDNAAAAGDATKHLLSLGHRRIAFVSHAPLEYRAAAERYRGYAVAVAEAGVTRRLPPRVPDYGWRGSAARRKAALGPLVRIGGFSEESGYACASDLLALRVRPTAILAGNDLVAYGVMQAAKDVGLRIPEDVSIVGIDDDYLSRFTNPPLSTVAVPAAGLGAEAARLIVRAIAEPNDRTPQRIALSHNLTIRQSSAPPPRS